MCVLLDAWLLGCAAVRLCACVCGSSFYTGLQVTFMTNNDSHVERGCGPALHVHAVVMGAADSFGSCVSHLHTRSQTNNWGCCVLQM